MYPNSLSFINHLVRRCVVLVTGAFVVPACSAPTAPLAGGPAVASLVVSAAGVDASVSALVVEVSAADIPVPLAFNLELSGGTTTGTLAIPIGSGRLISVRAFDVTGEETHRGEKTIDVVAGGNPTVNIVLTPRLGDVPITVSMGSVAISLTPAELVLEIGQTGALSALVASSTGDTLSEPVSWASLNPAVAAVDQDGLVTAVGAGQTEIVAVYGGVAASAPVSVSPPVVGAGEWSVSQLGTILEVGYGSGTHFPQFVALHLDSGYLRMVYGESSGWGTSMILPPAFWSNGTYYQGAPVDYTWETEGDDLLLHVSGGIGPLAFVGVLRFAPPAGDEFRATVSMEVTGTVELDVRPGEAFKVAMMSSMHVTESSWDAKSAYVGDQTFEIPSSGWLIPSPIDGTVWGLRGGTSAWKANAPTMEVRTADAFPVQGWITATSNPNNENIGWWSASESMVQSWTYEVTAKR